MPEKLKHVVASCPQSFTSAEKAQARENIDAAQDLTVNSSDGSIEVLYDLSSKTIDLKLGADGQSNVYIFDQYEFVDNYSNIMNAVGAGKIVVCRAYNSQLKYTLQKITTESNVQTFYFTAVTANMDLRGNQYVQSTRVHSLQMEYNTVTHAFDEIVNVQDLYTEGVGVTDGTNERYVDTLVLNTQDHSVKEFDKNTHDLTPLGLMAPYVENAPTASKVLSIPSGETVPEWVDMQSAPDIQFKITVPEVGEHGGDSLTTYEELVEHIQAGHQLYNGDEYTGTYQPWIGIIKFMQTQYHGGNNYVELKMNTENSSAVFWRVYQDEYWDSSSPDFLNYGPVKNGTGNVVTGLSNLEATDAQTGARVWKLQYNTAHVPNIAKAVASKNVYSYSITQTDFTNGYVTVNLNNVSNLNGHVPIQRHVSVSGYSAGWILSTTTTDRIRFRFIFTSEGGALASLDSGWQIIVPEEWAQSSYFNFDTTYYPTSASNLTQVSLKIIFGSDSDTMVSSVLSFNAVITDLYDADA